ncbi:hypothetical protein [Mesorhizobium sp. LjNodule214]|uniref:hypothetical protein n=1 Tax=Mesorhizobium sp. LjNodule214 TaxID=3342252 RepID=UPI003ECE51AE
MTLIGVAAGRVTLSKAMASARIADTIIYLPGLLGLAAVIGFNEQTQQFGLYSLIASGAVKEIPGALLFPGSLRANRVRAGH